MAWDTSASVKHPYDKDGANADGASAHSSHCRQVAWGTYPGELLRRKRLQVYVPVQAKATLRFLPAISLAQYVGVLGVIPAE